MWEGEVVRLWWGSGALLGLLVGGLPLGCESSVENVRVPPE